MCFQMEKNRKPKFRRSNVNEKRGQIWNSIDDDCVNMTSIAFYDRKEYSEAKRTVEIGKKNETQMA